MPPTFLDHIKQLLVAREARASAQAQEQGVVIVCDDYATSRIVSIMLDKAKLPYVLDSRRMVFVPEPPAAQRPADQPTADQPTEEAATAMIDINQQTCYAAIIRFALDYLAKDMIMDDVATSLLATLAAAGAPLPCVPNRGFFTAIAARVDALPPDTLVPAPESREVTIYTVYKEESNIAASGWVKFETLDRAAALGELAQSPHYRLGVQVQPYGAMRRAVLEKLKPFELQILGFTVPPDQAAL